MLKSHFRRESGMSVGRLRQVGISIALGSSLVLGCGSETTETPAVDKTQEPGAEATAPAPAVDPAAVSPAELPDFDTLPTVELPAAFPKDVPLYPGARTVKATPDPWTPENWVAQFSTPDAPATVSASLVDTLAAQGWTTESTQVSDGIMVYANKDGRSATYALSTSRGKTVMSVIFIANP
jgi:hypothetical protein